MTTDSRRYVSIALVVVLGAGAAWAAKPSRFSLGLTNYAPPSITGARLTLLEAVELAVQHDPAIYQAREDTLFSAGSLRQSTGLFDSTFQIGGSYHLNIAELSEGERKAEENKRLVARTTAEILQTIADDLRRQLAETEGFVYPQCPPGLFLVVAGQDICVTPQQQADIQLTGDLAGALGLDQTQADLIDYGRSIATTNLLLLDDAAFQVREALRKLGQVPDYQDKTSIVLDLGLLKKFRSGLLVRPGIKLDSVKDIYRGKRREAEWGGKGKPDTVRSEINIRFDMPLGKGSGRVSTGAAEEAARLNFEASRNTQAHTFAQTTLRVSLAYWNVVAAQERLLLLEESVKTNEEIFEIGRGMLEVGELVSSDLARTKARLAEAKAQYLEARQALLEARRALANAVGLAIGRAEDLPSAVDGWPAMPTGSDLDQLRTAGLYDLALASRADAAASRFLQASARVLADAARADLKARVDLSLTLGYRTLNEGGSITSMSGLLTAWGDALSAWSPGPSGKLLLGFEWPFGNNAAHGRYEQSQSLHYQSAIRSTDLERVIGTNVERLAGSLAEAIREVDDRGTSAAHYGELVASELDKFRLGESTVIDIVFTEQEQISQQLALVSARQNVASLMSQLRFETGTLLDYRIEGPGVAVDGVRLDGYDFMR